MMHFFSKFLKKNGHTKKTKQPNFRRLSLESLEGRVLLTATPAVPDFLVGDGNVQSGLHAVAMDPAGDFVVVWEETAFSPSFSFNIWAQRYNPDAVAQGGPILVANIPPSGSGSTEVTAPAVAMDSAGDFVVTWSENFFSSTTDGHVLARRFHADGTPIDGGAFLVFDSNDKGPVSATSVGADANLAFSVVWTFEFSSTDKILLQAYAADFTSPPPPIFGSPFDVSGSFAASSGVAPSVAENAAGQFVVVWAEPASSSGNGFFSFGPGDVFARPFAPGGSPGSIVQVNSAGINQAETPPSVGIDGSGNFAVGWSTANQFFSQTFFPLPFSFSFSSVPGDVFLRQFSSSGSALAPEFAVNLTKVNFPTGVAVAENTFGDIAVAWATGNNSFNRRIFVTQFDHDPSEPDGAPVFELPVNNPLNPATAGPAIAMDSFEDFVVAWTTQFFESELDLVDPVFATLWTDRRPPPPPPPTPSPSSENPPPPVEPPTNNPFPFIPTLTEVLPPPGQSLPVSVVFPVSIEVQSGTSATCSISGQVFEDFNKNGIQDADEPALPGQIVYLDVNNNGKWDEGEPRRITNEKGEYSFNNLPPAKYVVRQLLRPFMAETFPKEGQYNVDLAGEKRAYDGVNFSIVQKGRPRHRRPQPVNPDFTPADETEQQFTPGPTPAPVNRPQSFLPPPVQPDLDSSSRVAPVAKSNTQEEIWLAAVACWALGSQILLDEKFSEKAEPKAEDGLLASLFDN